MPGGSSGGSARRAGDRRGGARARHRHRRLDPHPRRVLRRLRPEADLRPRSRRRRLPARPLARPRRPDGAHAGRRTLFYEALTGARARPSGAADRDLPRPARCARSSPASSARSTPPSPRSTRVEVGFEEPEHIYPTYAPIQNAEAALAHARPLPRAPRRVRRGRRARGSRCARTVTLAEYVEATLVRERIRAELRAAVRRGRPAADADRRRPARADRRRRAGLPRRRAALHRPAGPRRACRRAPCPVGFDDLGLPVGVQLTGPPRSEGRVLAAAEALFSATASARAESASAR